MKTTQLPHRVELVRRYDPSLGVSCVSPDGKWCLFQDDDAPSVTMWSIQDGKAVRCFDFKGGQAVSPGLEMFRSVSFSPDGRFVIAGGHGGCVCIWDRESGKLVEKVIDGIDAYLGYVRSAVSDENNKIILVGAMYRNQAVRATPSMDLPDLSISTLLSTGSVR